MILISERLYHNFQINQYVYLLKKKIKITVTLSNHYIIKQIYYKNERKNALNYEIQKRNKIQFIQHSQPC